MLLPGKKKYKERLSTTRKIMLSFAFGIALGTLLLMLPISSADGRGVPFMDALFTATTAVCVTGLVTVPVFSTFSFFGQVIILILIQAGGLGIITIMYGILIRFRKKMRLSETFLMQDVFNIDTLSGMEHFMKSVIFGTFVVEGVGALLYMTVFIPQFGIRGVWISIFNSISAFCNAGIDVISDQSLCPYVGNFTVNAVTSALVILGGAGFVVWWDVIRAARQWKIKGPRSLEFLTLHSKIVISSTVFLLLVGGLLFYIFEYNNPATIGDMSIFGKVQTSLFQSMTTRTAGFATIPQENLREESVVVALLLMFIGGSPVGTAGGVKTVTVVVLLTSALATIRDKKEVELFDRRIARQAVGKAVAVVCTSFLIMFTSTVLLAAFTNFSLIDIMYETVSATATVGLTRNLTSSLNLPGMIVIILTMYFGRVGPISLLIAFNTKRSGENSIKNPVEDVSVG